MKKQLLTLFSVLSVSTIFAQIPNAGMEMWGSTAGEPQGPTNYVSANILASPLISTQNPTSVSQATGVDAHSGNVSAKITTVKIVQNPSGGAIPDTVGVLLLGAVQTFPSPALKPGAPCTSRLASLDFFYKYAPVNSDNGAMVAYLTRWVGAGVRDTLAVATYPMNTLVNSYTSVSVPFVNNPSFPVSTLPDSLRIYFLSSARPWINSALVPNPAQIGSTLWIDDISATVVGMKESIKLNQLVKVYPNPANTYVNISVTNEDAMFVDVYDITGKKLASSVIDDNKVRINTESFNDGLYLYSIKDKDKKVIATGKLNVSK